MLLCAFCIGSGVSEHREQAQHNIIIVTVFLSMLVYTVDLRLAVEHKLAWYMILIMDTTGDSCLLFDNLKEVKPQSCQNNTIHNVI